MIGFQNF
jgi:hypothetical protein